MYRDAAERRKEIIRSAATASLLAVNAQLMDAVAQRQWARVEELNQEKVRLETRQRKLAAWDGFGPIPA